MFKVFLITALICFRLAASAKDAKPQRNIWVPTDGSHIGIKMGYTFGTHKLFSNEIIGQIERGSRLEEVKGELVVPLFSIKEGSAKLECHLREALGIDYKNSDYPKEHVCDDSNHLPAVGKNSVAYPDLVLKIEGLEKLADRYRIKGEWVIHGRSQPAKDAEVFIVSETPDSLSLKANLNFRLEDFGIVVKKAFVVSVADTAQVEVILNLKKQ